MTTNHHPSADMLLQYSAGTASPNHALCVATHLEFCSTCRSAHQRNNAIGGKLLDAIGDDENIAVDRDIKMKVFSLLDAEPRQPTITKDAETSDARKGIPRALRRLVPNGFGDLKWQTVSTSARNFQLFRDTDGTTVSLLKLKPGGKIAKHKHMGNEYTVVLTGAFSDEDGVYRAGDFLLRDANEAHSPVATRDAECICLTLQEAPLQFTGWFLRWLNPWIRNHFQPG